MPSLLTAMVSLGFLATTTVHAAVPVLILDCGYYPDVCDNTCNAVHCYGLGDANTYLHYDKYSGSDKPNPKTKQTAADLRRAAIGCGGSNYCPTGTDCDEFPYASTYDGGLGCIVDNYKGKDRLAMAGTTRCSDPDQNQEHGRDLKAFYRDEALKDGERFQVGFSSKTIKKAPLCARLNKYGESECPNVSSGDYRYRSTPERDSYCPPRGRFRRGPFDGAAMRQWEESEEGQRLARAETDEDRAAHREQRRNTTITQHTVKLSDGTEFTTFFGPKPVVGTSVSRRGENGRLVQLKVVHSD